MNRIIATIALLLFSSLASAQVKEPEVSVGWGSVLSNESATFSKESQFVSIQAKVVSVPYLDFDSGVAAELGLGASAWRVLQTNRKAVPNTPLYAGVDFQLFRNHPEFDVVPLSANRDDDDDDDDGEPPTSGSSGDARADFDPRIVIGIQVAEFGAYRVAFESYFLEDARDVSFALMFGW